MLKKYFLNKLLKQIHQFFCVCFRAAARKEELSLKQSCTGASLQLAIMSTAILSIGAYSIQSISDTANKVTSTLLASGMIERVALNAHHNSLVAAAYYETARANENTSLTVACLNNYKHSSCPTLSTTTNGVKDRGGEFAFYGFDGKLISGVYNIFGHNCSDSAWKNKSVCNDRHKIIEVSKFKLLIKAENRAMNERDKLYVSYTIRDLRSGDLISGLHARKHLFEVKSIYQNTRCGNKQWVAKISKGGDVVCDTATAYVGPVGIAGQDGKVGKTGSAGSNGPTGPRGPRGAIATPRGLGCLAKDTQVLMSDGLYKKISEVSIGDLVFNPMTGGATEVAFVSAGPEVEPMVDISLYSGGDISATKNHPFRVIDFVTGAELVKTASELRLSDVLVTREGARFISRIGSSQPKSQENVYNLSLMNSIKSGESFFVANGIISGDLKVQNRMQQTILSEKN